jgi:hypothetical protein
MADVGRKAAKPRRAWSIRCAATLAFACACTQAGSAEKPPPRYELTAYAAYRIGGEFPEEEPGTDAFELEESDAQGIIFNARAKEPNTQWEALYVRQDTQLDTLPSFSGGGPLDIDVEYYHFGGTYVFESESVLPFIALTAGLARFEPGPSEIDAENYFSGSFGAGLQIRPMQHVGVRLEARVFVSLVNSDGALFCRTGPEANVCAIRIDGETLWQWEARAGVVYRF